MATEFALSRSPSSFAIPAALPRQLAACLLRRTFPVPSAIRIQAGISISPEMPIATARNTGRMSGNFPCGCKDCLQNTRHVNGGAGTAPRWVRRRVPLEGAFQPFHQYRHGLANVEPQPKKPGITEYDHQGMAAAPGKRERAEVYLSLAPRRRLEPDRRFDRLARPRRTHIVAYPDPGRNLAGTGAGSRANGWSGRIRH